MVKVTTFAAFANVVVGLLLAILEVLIVGAVVSYVIPVTVAWVALFPAASVPSKAILYTAPSTREGGLLRADNAKDPLFNSLPVNVTVCGELESALPPVRV